MHSLELMYEHGKELSPGDDGLQFDLSDLFLYCPR